MYEFDFFSQQTKKNPPYFYFQPIRLARKYVKFVYSCGKYPHPRQFSNTTIRLPRYDDLASETLHDHVTMTFDLLTLETRYLSSVMWSVPPLNFSILGMSVLEL